MSRRQPRGEYIETDTGNKVARKATLVGTQNIMLGGKTVIQPEVMIRGDLARTLPSSSSGAGGAPANNTAVSIGRYCFLSRGCCLRPPGRIYKGAFTHLPLRMGDHVFVGPGAVVQAATIGSHVHIGADVVVGEFAIIKDYVRILDGAVLAPNTVIPSFSIVAGRPARVVGEVPEGGHEAFELRELYKSVGNNPAPSASSAATATSRHVLGDDPAFWACRPSGLVLKRAIGTASASAVLATVGHVGGWWRLGRVGHVRHQRLEDPPSSPRPSSHLPAPGAGWGAQLGPMYRRRAANPVMQQAADAPWTK
ncbi:hypothetical protein VTK73DRAFT_7896 [Phialemonium thermophilum]|uniref:Dynactin subunit 5 n=1 Tax=Phialemonium thermophilum TaxID=223376 RepID=A0ABR3WC45_9PEZI